MATIPSSSLSTSRAVLVPVLKGFVTVSSLFVAGGMAATSFQFVPSLIAAANTKEPLNSLEDDDDHLTPQNTQIKSVGGPKLGSSDSYKIAAQQFSSMSQTAFISQVPLELLSILSSAYLAWHYRSHVLTPHVWKSWTAVAGLLAAVFPFTGALMVPIDHKIAQIAGHEERVEPFEDAIVDRAAEKSNAVEFLRKWNNLNGARSVIMLTAGSIGLWSFLV